MADSDTVDDESITFSYGVCYETRPRDGSKTFPRYLFPQWHVFGQVLQ